MSAVPHEVPPPALVSASKPRLALVDVVTEAGRLHADTRAAIADHRVAGSAERAEILDGVRRLEDRMNARDLADGFAAADLRSEVAELREALPIDGVFAEIIETLARVEQFLGGVATTSADRLTIS